jgi:8-oxo-dGTP diphosphatase
MPFLASWRLGVGWGFVTRPVLEVGAALVFKDGKFLITQRKQDDSFGGFWELPGGKKEPTESLEECVIRELKEELDIEVEIRHFFRILTYHYPQRSVRLNVFFCSHKSGEPRKIECQDLAWVFPKDLPSYKFPDADQDLVRELARRDDWDRYLEGLKYPHEYLEGIRLFNAGEYFECHEMLEDLWHPSQGLERLHYQGLIQAAIALEHLRKNNLAGAMGLYGKACEKWAQLPETYMGVDLKGLREALGRFFDPVFKGGPGGPEWPLVPRIPEPQ